MTFEGILSISAVGFTALIVVILWLAQPSQFLATFREPRRTVFWWDMAPSELLYIMKRAPKRIEERLDQLESQ